MYSELDQLLDSAVTGCEASLFDCWRRYLEKKLSTEPKVTPTLRAVELLTANHGLLTIRRAVDEAGVSMRAL